MVCLGNICRSPMAEGILRSKAMQQGIDLEIDSCGTSNYHIGEAPDPRAIQKMKEYGIDISMLKARQFRLEDFSRFDRIYVMDQSNYRDVLALANSETDKAKVKMILSEIDKTSMHSVPDPWFGEADGFEDVYHLLDNACERIIASLK